MSLDSTSLPDAEAGEDDTEQIVGRELARDGVEGVLRQAQLLGQQVQRRPGAFQLRGRLHEVGVHGAQGFDVARAGDVHALRSRLPTRDLQLLPTQRIQPLAGARGQQQGRGQAGGGNGTA